MPTQGPGRKSNGEKFGLGPPASSIGIAAVSTKEPAPGSWGWPTRCSGGRSWHQKLGPGSGLGGRPAGGTLDWGGPQGVRGGPKAAVLNVVHGRPESSVERTQLRVDSSYDGTGNLLTQTRYANLAGTQ